MADEKKQSLGAEKGQKIETKLPTVYGRIQRVRAELSKMNLKKSGKNKFTQNTYYELGDFEPQLNALCDQQGIMPLFTLKKDISVLRVINVDDAKDSATFHIPTAASQVKGATDIQNLGAQITYLRRYLLMIAFEISEGDTEDAQTQEDIKTLDAIHIDKINEAKDLKKLADVSGALQKELGMEFRKAIVAEYTRRKKEIEAEAADDIANDVDEGLKKEQKNDTA